MNNCNLDELTKKLPFIPDIFISCISFEKRCLSVPIALKELNIRFPILFQVEEFISSSTDNKIMLDVIFNNNFNVVFSIKKPIDFVDKFIDKLDEIINIIDNPKIVIDITTFTRDSLLMLIGILYQRSHLIGDLCFLYAPAKTMSNEWLSRGFRGLRSVLGYPGERSSLKPLHIVVMTGFEIERTKYIVDEYEPELISIGMGSSKESINPDFYSRNRKFVDELLSQYDETRIKQFEFSLIDPFKTIEALEKHIDMFSAYNTVIAPLNNKISTIGAALYALKHQEIQICYLPAEEYNTKDYSESGDLVYFGEIEFSEIKENLSLSLNVSVGERIPLKTHSGPVAIDIDPLQMENNLTSSIATRLGVE